MTQQDKRKELKVSAIENGTVIDHIPAQSVFQVINILNLYKIPNQIMVGTNLESSKLGKKGIIKVSNKYFESEEINKIALVAPSATLIVIKDYTVVYKAKVKFSVIDKEDLRLLCHYCEKVTKKENIKFL
jgi:aspartate carbamoyltransferase regulatory subunit